MVQANVAIAIIIIVLFVVLAIVAWLIYSLYVRTQRVDHLKRAELESDASSLRIVREEQRFRRPERVVRLGRFEERAYGPAPPAAVVVVPGIIRRQEPGSGGIRDLPSSNSS